MKLSIWLDFHLNVCRYHPNAVKHSLLVCHSSKPFRQIGGAA